MKTRIDCHILRGFNWVPAHLSEVKKGDFMRLAGDVEGEDIIYHVKEDAEFRDGEWRVEAQYDRRFKKRGMI